MEWIAKNLERVRGELLTACQRAGRDPHRVTLVCVTKGQPPEAIRAAWQAGVRACGENRLQEAQPKIAALHDLSGLTWHLVGHLQTNKVKLAVELFDAVHSVDSLRLAEALERQCAVKDTRARVFLQVNLSGEARKHGVTVTEAEPLGQYLREAQHLTWCGLMTIAPAADDPDRVRPVFRDLRQLRERLQRSLSASDLQLSMGMSHDFAVAVEEGADVVRIGTAIFQQDFWP